MSKLDFVLSRLEGVRERPGKPYLALCPAHDDHAPSLSVRLGDDGGVCLRCFAGCEFVDILAALGLEPKDVFSDNGHRQAGDFQIVAEYDYLDAKGDLLFQVVRKENGITKKFVQRQPGSAGAWIWNVKGVDPVLYHLPEILAAGPDDWIFIAEGEKSTDAVRSLGLVCTTNPRGAGKWDPAYSKTLQGRKVCILPDRDNAGDNHAALVSSALLEVAAEVRIVRLPSVCLKSDPYDWIAAGGTKSELLDLLEQAENVHSAPLYWTSKNQPLTQDYIDALASLGYTFRMNTCNDLVEVNGRALSDALAAKMRSQMRDLNYRQVNVLQDAWTAHAHDNRYHPIRDFLGGLTWDGQEHIERLCSCFRDKHGVFYVFLRRWLVGAVARAFEPNGCQNRMLVLDGAQGIGKSYFVRWLASPLKRPGLFIEGPIAPDDKDSQIRLITAWIWEVSELGSTTRRSDREALKYFLSMQQVTVRKPYGHNDLVKPALSSFIGTVNDVAGFLDDPTGYRRFMAANLTGIDWAYAKEIDPAQVWAQAKTLYDSGERWELGKEESERARQINLTYEVDDPLQDIFLRCYKVTGEPADFVATVDIRDTLNGHGWRMNSPRGETMAIAAMLKGMGLEKVQHRNQGGDRERGYCGIKRNARPVEV